VKEQQETQLVVRQNEFSLRIRELEEELAHYRDKVGAEEAAAQALEQYKKRAQSALQKVN
jgi:hypothetical protein